MNEVKTDNSIRPHTKNGSRFNVILLSFMISITDKDKNTEITSTWTKTSIHSTLFPGYFYLFDEFDSGERASDPGDENAFHCIQSIS